MRKRGLQANPHAASTVGRTPGNRSSAARSAAGITRSMAACCAAQSGEDHREHGGSRAYSTITRSTGGLEAPRSANHVRPSTRRSKCRS